MDTVRSPRGIDKTVLAALLLVCFTSTRPGRESVQSTYAGEADGPPATVAAPPVNLAVFSVPELIRAASSRLHHEAASIQIQGRGLTPGEQTRLEDVHRAGSSLAAALRILEKGDGEDEDRRIALPRPRAKRSPVDRIQRMIDELGNESTNIQIQGRALTPAEQKRSKAIDATIPHLQKALETLKAAGPPTPDG